MKTALALCAALLAPSLLAAPAPEPPRPVLLMGDKYGRYERQRWVQKLLIPEQVVFTSSDEWVPPARWKEFSLVVVCDTSPAALDMAGGAEARAYMEAGGCLLALGDGLRSLLGLAPGAPFPSWAAWVGAGEASLQRNLGRYAIEERVHPFEKAAPPKDGGWGADLLALSKLRGARVVVGAGGKALVAVNPVGKGCFVFVGPLLFRTLDAGSREESSSKRAAQLEASLKRMTDPLEKRKLEERVAALKKQAEAADKADVHDAASLEAMLAAALKAIAPATARGQAAAAIGSLAADGAPLVAWQREPVSDASVYAFAEMVDGPVFSPAVPAAAEVQRAIAVDLAASDTFAKAINVTAATDAAGLEPSLGELRSESGAAFPRANVELLRQARFRAPKVAGRPEDPAESAFWLLPAGRLDLKRAETAVFWLRVRAKGAPPGVYRGELSFACAAGSVRQPVTVTVWKVAAPARPEIQLGLYGGYWLAALPARYANPGDPAAQQPVGLPKALAVLDDMVEHGCRHAADTGLDLRRIRVKANGRALDSYAARGTAQPAELFAPGGEVPPLEFFGYEEQAAEAAKRGCFHAAIRHGRGAMLGDANYVCRLTGEPMGSPTWNKVFTGLWKQFHDFLAAKGFTEFTFKYGDELGPDETRQHWAPMARLAKAAGWRPEANWTGVAVNPDLMNEMAPLCESWTLNANFTEQFLKWRAEGAVRPPADARVSHYGSWGYYKAPHAHPRLAMWEAWARGLRGVDVYTYARLALWDGARMVPSAAWEGWRDGWTEANLLALLKRRSAEVAAKAPGDPWAARALKFLETVIGPSSPYGIAWVDGKAPNFPYPFRVLAGPEADLDRARHDLLALLSEAP
jgi:hypothetical protein